MIKDYWAEFYALLFAVTCIGLGILYAIVWESKCSLILFGGAFAVQNAPHFRFLCNIAKFDPGFLLILHNRHSPGIMIQLFQKER